MTRAWRFCQVIKRKNKGYKRVTRKEKDLKTTLLGVSYAILVPRDVFFDFSLGSPRFLGTLKELFMVKC